jgi:diguanylate cyclase (GGDEF)-like protein/PAS domain S-box-containing protein
MAIRNLVVGVGSLIIWFQCFWLMLFRVDRDMRPATSGVGLVFGLFCLVNIGRIVQALLLPKGSYDFMQSGASQALPLIAYDVLLILLTVTLVLMVNRRLFRELKHQEQKFATAFHSSPYAIVLTRLQDGTIFEVNDGFSKLTGYSSSEVVGHTTRELRIWAQYEDRQAIVKELLESGSVHDREVVFRKRSGELITGMCSTEVMTINDEECVLLSFNDISERKCMEEEIRELSLRDTLTGLYNLRGFSLIAEQKVKEVNRTKWRAYLTFVDFDGLKVINDTLGHDEGDRALVDTANILLSTFRETDVVGRVGGDEFATFTVEAADFGPEVFLARLRDNIAALNQTQSRPYRLAMSWGTATYDPAAPRSLDDLKAEADALMYQHKRAATPA